MNADSNAPLGTSRIEWFRDFAQRARAERAAKQAANSTTVSHAAGDPLPSEFVQWAKNARTRHVITGQLLTYIDAGAARRLFKETRDGLGSMLTEVWAYCDLKCPEQQEALVVNLNEHGVNPREYMQIVTSAKEGVA